MLTPRDPRRSQLARIHAAAKQLGMDEATYRALLRRVAGKDSAGAMSTTERNAVITEMVRLGFREVERAERRRAWAGRPNTTDQVPMLRKVEALLTDAGRPWSYAHRVARQMYQVNRVEWLNQDQLHRLVAALQVDANRRK